jgi:L-ascorbate metabolism protein UlaG (beta-lactamase superfamily)
MHYGTFPVLTGRPEDLAAKVKADGVRVWPLKQGETVSW